MDGDAIYRSEAEFGLLLLKNRPPYSGVTYPFCFKPYMGLSHPSGIRQHEQLRFFYKESYSFLSAAQIKKIWIRETL